MKFYIAAIYVRVVADLQAEDEIGLIEVNGDRQFS